MKKNTSLLAPKYYIGQQVVVTLQPKAHSVILEDATFENGEWTYKVGGEKVTDQDIIFYLNNNEWIEVDYEDCYPELGLV